MLAVREVVERFRRVRAEVEPFGAEILVAAKGRAPELLRVVWEEGADWIGENRWQEAREHQRALPEVPREKWHYIGKIQRRKAGKLVSTFACIQTVENLEQALWLERHLEEPLSVLIQVNIGREVTKQGVLPEGLSQLVEDLLRETQRLRIVGLMCLPPYTENPESNRSYFRQMRVLYETLPADARVERRWLSMGTSQDYRVALEEGSNMVRLGQVIFGPL